LAKRLLEIGLKDLLRLHFRPTRSKPTDFLNRERCPVLRGCQASLGKTGGFRSLVVAIHPAEL
jgi:hypothetical protein